MINKQLALDKHYVNTQCRLLLYSSYNNHESLCIQFQCYLNRHIQESLKFMPRNLL